RGAGGWEAAVELLPDVVEELVVLELDEDDVELVDELVDDDVVGGGAVVLVDVLVLVVCEVDVVELVDVVLVVDGGTTSANRFCASIVPRPVTMSYPGPAVKSPFEPVV